jgi:hypothetical protein
MEAQLPRAAYELVLFQFGPVHEELAPPFVSAARSLNINTLSLLNQGSFNAKGNVFHALEKGMGPKPDVICHKALQQSENLDRVVSLMVEANPRLVVFLTLQNPWTVDLAARLMKKGLEVAGIIHNVKKMMRIPEVRSFWTDSRAKPITLSLHVKSMLDQVLPLRQQESLLFHSVQQPEVTRDSGTTTPLRTIALPGGVSYDNRPYGMLLNRLQSQPSGRSIQLHNSSFLILGGGKDRDRLLADVSRLRLEDRFSFAPVLENSGRTSYETYYQGLMQSSAVLFMDSEQYSTSKISSAVPTALSFGLPLICSELVAATYGIREASISASSLEDALCRFDSMDSHSLSFLRAHSLALRDSQCEQNARTLHFMLNNTASCQVK